MIINKAGICSNRKRERYGEMFRAEDTSPVKPGGEAGVKLDEE
jgi:hypothetical protein